MPDDYNKSIRPNQWKVGKSEVAPPDEIEANLYLEDIFEVS